MHAATTLPIVGHAQSRPPHCRPPAPGGGGVCPSPPGPDPARRPRQAAWGPGTWGGSRRWGFCSSVHVPPAAAPSVLGNGCFKSCLPVNRYPPSGGRAGFGGPVRDVPVAICAHVGSTDRGRQPHCSLHAGVALKGTWPPEPRGRAACAPGPGKSCCVPPCGHRREGPSVPRAEELAAQGTSSWTAGGRHPECSV